jgi:MscS family membrane protein
MENFTEFWKLVTDVWQGGFGGIDVGRLLIAASIFIGFLLIRRLFTRLILSRLKSWASKTNTSIDDEAIKALENPIRFIPITLGIFFSAQYLQLIGVFAEIADSIVKSLIAFSIFWAFLQLLQPLSRFATKIEEHLTHELVEWLVKAVRIAIILVGTATVLQIWGIQVGPIVAGAGLFGVAVALGAQDLFKNLIAGLLIIGEKRFRKGHSIRVEGVVEGTVESIGFRSTVVRKFDKTPVMVPNTKLADTAVINLSARTHRRIYWNIGLEYGTSVIQLQNIRDEIESYIIKTKDFVSPDEIETFIRIDSFNASSIDLMLYCFTHTTKWGEWLKIKEQLAYRVKEIVEGADAGFAFPSQSLYIESFPSERPEVFVPPKK